MSEKPICMDCASEACGLIPFRGAWICGPCLESRLTALEAELSTARAERDAAVTGNEARRGRLAWAIDEIGRLRVDMGMPCGCSMLDEALKDLASDAGSRLLARMAAAENDRDAAVADRDRLAGEVERARGENSALCVRLSAVDGELVKAHEERDAMAARVEAGRAVARQWHYAADPGKWECAKEIEAALSPSPLAAAYARVVEAAGEETDLEVLADHNNGPNVTAAYEARLEEAQVKRRTAVRALDAARGEGGGGTP